MRDLLDKLLFLTESTGLAGRNPGDKFVNPQTGHELSFQNIYFEPEGGGKLQPDEIDLIKNSPLNSDVKWLNKQTSKTGGIAIADFVDSSGQKFRIGQFMDKVNPNPRSNYVPNAFLGYSLQTKASKKTQEKLKPQDLLTDKVDLTIADIMNQLAKSLGTDSQLYDVAHKLATGTPLPYQFPAPEGVTFSGFRDYFCEILQPIALQMGQYTGNAGEAAEKFLNGSFQNTTITFDESVTAGLSDSILKTKDGKTVLISTKGGRGAAASAKNLYDKIIQLEKSKDGLKFLEKYAEAVDIIKNIVATGQNGSPLYLATKYKILTKDEADTIRGLRGDPPVDLTDKKELKKLERLYGPKIIDLAKSRETKTPQSTDLYHHLLAIIADLGAEQVNKKTNFSKAAAEILNNGALVQVYTKAKEGKTGWTLEEFNTVFPSDAIKGVYLSSKKTHYSTGIKGNYTFLIDKGSGAPKEEPAADSAPADIDYEKTKEKIKTGITDIFRGEPGPDDERGAGRKRR